MWPLEPSSVNALVWQYGKQRILRGTEVESLQGMLKLIQLHSPAPFLDHRVNKMGPSGCMLFRWSEFDILYPQDLRTFGGIRFQKA